MLYPAMPVFHGILNVRMYYPEFPPRVSSSYKIEKYNLLFVPDRLVCREPSPIFPVQNDIQDEIQTDALSEILHLLPHRSIYPP